MEVKIRGKRYGIGRGPNKKEAEQRAATMALKRLKLEENETKKDDKKEVVGLRGFISRARRRIKLP